MYLGMGNSPGWPVHAVSPRLRAPGVPLCPAEHPCHNPCWKRGIPAAGRGRGARPGVGARPGRPS
eukprot:6853647-Lingulodinium_polyedra.AAC.1